MPSTPPAAPRFISAGEALTDLIRQENGYWLARAGGAPWNVARVVARFGIPSAFAGSVSRDNFGDEIAALSREAGLDSRFLQQYDKSPLLAVVHETSPPRYHFIGTDSADLAFNPKLLPNDWTLLCEWLHCGGISLAREPLRDRLIGMLESAKAAGVRISFDPNFRNLMTATYDATLERVAALADVIKVSDEDLRGLFRTRDVDAALLQLKALNPHALILFTRGAGGAELHVSGKRLHQASPSLNIVDTVGAGDASIGGLLGSLMNHPAADWTTHLRFAIAAGTAACLQPGASPPTLVGLQAADANGLKQISRCAARVHEEHEKNRLVFISVSCAPLRKRRLYEKQGSLLRMREAWTIRMDWRGSRQSLHNKKSGETACTISSSATARSSTARVRRGASPT